jgi:hypothetical protein
MMLAPEQNVPRFSQADSLRRLPFVSRFLTDIPTLNKHVGLLASPLSAAALHSSQRSQREALACGERIWNS